MAGLVGPTARRWRRAPSWSRRRCRGCSPAFTLPWLRSPRSCGRWQHPRSPRPRAGPSSTSTPGFVHGEDDRGLDQDIAEIGRLSVPPRLAGQVVIGDAHHIGKKDPRSRQDRCRARRQCRRPPRPCHRDGDAAPSRHACRRRAGRRQGCRRGAAGRARDAAGSNPGRGSPASRPPRRCARSSNRCAIP